MKICVKCSITKEISEFNIRRKECKECRLLYGKQYRLANKKNANEYAKQYRLHNKLKIQEENKQYRLDNKVKIQEQKKIYRTNKRINNPLYKLTCNTRDLIRKSIRRMGYSKTSRTHQMLGCTFEEFKSHLESQFTEGMTWENAGQWHLDHIHPVSLATDEEHLIRLNHYTNFQPLWAEDNLKKGNRI